MFSGPFELELYRYCGELEVMQIACGDPIPLIWDLNVPWLSNTWMLLLPESATYTFPFLSNATSAGRLNDSLDVPAPGGRVPAAPPPSPPPPPPPPVAGGGTEESSSTILARTPGPGRTEIASGFRPMTPRSRPCE